MGWELHAPLGPNSPKVLEIRETYAEIDSPRLGFVADFSSTMHSMSPTILRKLGEDGPGRTRSSTGCRRSGRPTPTSTPGTASSSSTCTRAASPRRASARSPGWRSTCTGTSTRPSGPTSCRRSSTCTPSSTTSTSTATSRRSTTRRSSASSSNGGYSGFFSSEWEGHAFADLDEADPVDLVRKQHDLIRRSITAALTDKDS